MPTDFYSYPASENRPIQLPANFYLKWRWPVYRDMQLTLSICHFGEAEFNEVLIGQLYSLMASPLPQSIEDSMMPKYQCSSVVMMYQQVTYGHHIDEPCQAFGACKTQRCLSAPLAVHLPGMHS